MESIKVNSLDIADVTDADLQPTTYLREPGKYNFQVLDYQMGIKKSPDGAGKRWGWLRINVRDLASGALASGFIDVPVDSLVFTSNNGKTTNAKSGIFKSFLSSLGIKNVSVSNIAEHINNLGSILDARPEFTATIGYSQDHVMYRGKDEHGNSLFGIELKGGGPLLNEDGEEVRLNERDAIVDYYRQFKGFSPETGMNFKSFINNAK